MAFLALFLTLNTSATAQTGIAGGIRAHNGHSQLAAAVIRNIDSTWSFELDLTAGSDEYTLTPTPIYRIQLLTHLHLAFGLGPEVTILDHPLTPEQLATYLSYSTATYMAWSPWHRLSIVGGLDYRQPNVPTPTTRINLAIIFWLPHASNDTP